MARDSKELAEASKRDSSSMKVIAVLTTLFLPGTFIAVSSKSHPEMRQRVPGANSKCPTRRVSLPCPS